MNKVEKLENTGAAEPAVKPYKEFNFGFIKNRHIFFIITAVIIIIGVTSFITLGFNFDIDFVGGTILHYNIGSPLDEAELDNIRAIVREALPDEIGISSVRRAGAGNTEVIIRLLPTESGSATTEQRDSVFEALAEQYGLSRGTDIRDSDIITADNVDPLIGRELTRNTIISVLIAAALMLIYITVRFDFFSGATTVVCLLHDLFIMLTFYSLLQIPMSRVVIAAFLTVLAYSINATIVILDRIRENSRKRMKGANFTEIVNRSLNQTLTRSVNTTITTLFTIGMVYILGVPSIRDFSLPLIIGIVSGLYSSVFLAGPILVTFRRKKVAKERAEAEAEANS